MFDNILQIFYFIFVFSFPPECGATWEQLGGWSNAFFYHNTYVCKINGKCAYYLKSYTRTFLESLRNHKKQTNKKIKKRSPLASDQWLNKMLFTQ